MLLGHKLLAVERGCIHSYVLTLFYNAGTQRLILDMVCVLEIFSTGDIITR